jgi:hypothetical protein
MTNKKVVVATMRPQTWEFYFKVPEGIDLEDESVVEDYGFKYGQLHIKYVGKDDIESIEPYHEDEPDCKYAEHVEIVDNNECDRPYDSDEEEEEEEKEYECAKCGLLGCPDEFDEYVDICIDCRDGTCVLDGHCKEDDEEED